MVQNPEFAGFFICLDQSENRYDDPKQSMGEIDEIVSITQQYSIPLYIMRKGKFYCSEINENGDVVQGEVVDISTLTNSKYDIDGHREEIVEDILDGAPIKKELLASEEASLVNRYIEGKEYFQVLNGRVLISSARFEQIDPIAYHREINAKGHEEGGFYFKEGSEIRPLGEVYVGKEKFQYFIYSSTYYDPTRQSEITAHSVAYRKWQKDGSIRVNFAYSSDRPFENFYLESGLDHASQSFDDYFDQFEVRIQQKMANRAEFLEKYNDDRFYTDDTRKINGDCFELYGFAEEAEKSGDQELAKKAIAVANKYYPYEKYQELISCRVDEKGNFRLTRQDLSIDK